MRRGASIGANAILSVAMTSVNTALLHGAVDQGSALHALMVGIQAKRIG